MKRNREVRAMLNRSEARRLTVSPLAQHTVGQSGIQLAAIEIAKAIATGFRTDLSNHIVSLDLSGSDHQEALCGGPPSMLRLAARTSCKIPARAPIPLELTSERPAGHDQWRIPHHFVAGDGGALPQACEPSHRRGFPS